mgnify:CR=1 FL=1
MAMSETDMTTIHQLTVGDDGQLLCPCGHDYLHFYKVVVSQAPRDEHLVQDYTFKCIERICGPARPVVPSMERKSHLRGGGVSTTYWCEACGHLTHETRIFHKGMTYSKVVYDTSVDVHDEMFAAERDRGMAGSHDHWRDYDPDSL